MRATATATATAKKMTTTTSRVYSNDNIDGVTGTITITVTPNTTKQQTTDNRRKLWSSKEKALERPGIRNSLDNSRRTTIYDKFAAKLLEITANIRMGVEHSAKNAYDNVEDDGTRK